MISVIKSKFTLVFFKTACHANPGAEKNFQGSSSYISRHVFQKIPNVSDNNYVLLWIYKPRYSPKLFISKFLQTLFTCA